jgi:hypothetical protein
VEPARSKTHSLVQIRFILPAAVKKRYMAKHFQKSALKNAFERKKCDAKMP